MEKQLIPQLRFSEFEDNWWKSSLDKVVKYTKGYAFKSNTYENKGIRIVRVSDLGADSIKSNNEKLYISKKNSEGLEKYLLKKNDIIVTTVGSHPKLIESAVGRGVFVNNENEGFLNQNLLKIEQNSLIDSKFLFSHLNSSRYRYYIKGIKRGNANQANITVKELLEYRISLTSLEEQQKIASFLTDVDDKITKLTKKKTLLEQYKKGIMQKIFNQELRFKDDNGNEFPKWEVKKLGDISNITTGSSNRQDSGLDGEYTFFDRSEDIRTSSRYLFDGEAVIVAGEGSDFIPKYYVGKFDLHQRTYAIMNFKDSVSKYLYYCIYFHRKYFLSQAVGSTVKSLRLPMFQKMPIKLPVIEEQIKIANFLSDIDVKIEALNTKIEHSKSFKKGLLQQMFV
ncbi:restriction endonuclease subunit S [Bizionia sp. KMM 8389]